MSKVSQVEVNSALGTTTIRIDRKWTSLEGRVEDLPADARYDLIEWLGLTKIMEEYKELKFMRESVEK